MVASRVPTKSQPASPPAYKAIARTPDGVSLTGYGCTPKAAAADLVAAMPPPWRAKGLRSAEIRGHGGGGYLFVNVTPPPVVASAFWAVGVRASPRREWSFTAAPG